MDWQLSLICHKAFVKVPFVVIDITVTRKCHVKTRVCLSACAIATSGCSATKVVCHLFSAVFPEGGQHVRVVGVMDDGGLAIPSHKLGTFFGRVNNTDSLFPTSVIGQIGLELTGTFIALDLGYILLVVIYRYYSTTILLNTKAQFCCDIKENMLYGDFNSVNNVN